MRLTALYSFFDLKTKCVPLNKFVICSSGQALRFKALLELSKALILRAPSSQLAAIDSLKAFRVLCDLLPASNKTHNETDKKHIGSLAKR